MGLFDLIGAVVAAPIRITEMAIHTTGEIIEGVGTVGEVIVTAPMKVVEGTVAAMEDVSETAADLVTR